MIRDRKAAQAQARKSGELERKRQRERKRQQEEERRKQLRQERLAAERQEEARRQHQEQVRVEALDRRKQEQRTREDHDRISQRRETKRHIRVGIELPPNPRRNQHREQGKRLGVHSVRTPIMTPRQTREASKVDPREHERIEERQTKARTRAIENRRAALHAQEAEAMRRQSSAEGRRVQQALDEQERKQIKRRRLDERARVVENRLTGDRGKEPKTTRRQISADGRRPQQVVDPREHERIEERQTKARTRAIENRRAALHAQEAEATRRQSSAEGQRVQRGTERKVAEQRALSVTKARERRQVDWRDIRQQRSSSLPPRQSRGERERSGKEPRSARVPSGYLSNGLPWLQVAGNQIVSVETRRPVILRGVNRSGLEYSEPITVGSVFPFNDAAGISQSDIEEMVLDWGANVIRLPFNQDWALNGRSGLEPAIYLDALDQVIYWASNCGAYTLLDLQWLNADTVFGPPGSSSRVAPLPNADSITLWTLLATRYQHEPAVLYDIFNEPHSQILGDPNVLQGIREDGTTFEIMGGHVTMSEWQPWARQLVSAIRRVHTNSLIFVSGVDWSYNLRGMPLTIVPGGRKTFANLVYSTHVYPDKGPQSLPGVPEGLPGPASSASWYQAFGYLATAFPVFAGEWGVREMSEDTDRDTAWAEQLGRYLSSLRMGWTAWSWWDTPHIIRRFITPPYQPTRYGNVVLRYLAMP
jgi:endoglucanase